MTTVQGSNQDLNTVQYIRSDCDCVATRWYQSGGYLLGARLQVLASTLAAHKDAGTLNDQVNALAMDTTHLSR